MKQKKACIGNRRLVAIDDKTEKICENCLYRKRITGFRTGWTYLYCQLDVETPWLDNGKQVSYNDTCKYWKSK